VTDSSHIVTTIYTIKLLVPPFACSRHLRVCSLPAVPNVAEKRFRAELAAAAAAHIRLKSSLRVILVGSPELVGKALQSAAELVAAALFGY